jgi:hypothetical protein
VVVPYYLRQGFPYRKIYEKFPASNRTYNLAKNGIPFQKSSASGLYFLN